MDIPYNEALTPSNIALIQVEKMPENCRVITIDELKKDKYFTNKYLQKDKVICHGDLKQKSNNKIIFNFGSIQIETRGKIIYENDEYIKIKKENGKVEKIYKDGRDR
jgi:ribosomal protein L15